jgi:type IV pilus assembly protein PilM
LEKPSLVTFGIKKIIGSSQDAIATSIKSLTEELGISAKDVSIAVSGPSLIVRLISMPKMTDEELTSAVRFETEKFIPFDINDCILDFQILNKEAKDKGSVDILLAAAKKEHVWQKIKTVQDAGFAVKTVDVDILAMANAFLKNFPSLDKTKNFALVNIGASSTELSILLGDRPVFVREVMMGGNELSAAIAKKTGLSPEQSEELLLSPKERLAEVVGCAKAAITNLIDEVRLSFGYHENQSGRAVDEIYISGGGSRMAGLEDGFHEAFGSKPRYWDPFQVLDKSSPHINAEVLEKTKHSFCVAVGLALRG